MLEHDLIHQQILIFDELAKELLSGEALIKRQQRDYFQKGTRSLEAQKLEQAYFDIRLQSAICAEIHQHALQALRLKELSSAYLRSKEVDDAELAREEYNESMRVLLLRQVKELKPKLILQLTEVIAFLKDQIHKLKQFIQLLSHQIDELKNIKNKIIEAHIQPRIHRIKTQVGKKKLSYTTQAGEEVDLQEHLNHLWDLLMTKIKEGKVNGGHFEKALCNAPYEKGLIIQSIQHSYTKTLTEQDEVAIQHKVLQAMKEQRQYAEIIQILQNPIAKADKNILFLEKYQKAALKSQAKHQEQLIESQKALADSMTEFADIQKKVHQATRFLNSTPHLAQQNQHLIAEGHKALTFVESQKIGLALNNIPSKDADDPHFLFSI